VKPSRAIVALGVTIALSAPLAGLPLVVQDSAASADAIVVLAGDHVLERIHRAAQLYRDGYAPRVVISGGAIVRDGDEPMSEAQMMRRYIVRLSA
jgi:uncharacterized SAM-binding protein YcdF (DUF218 family)